jgi:hypothetical protein
MIADTDVFVRRLLLSDATADGAVSAPPGVALFVGEWSPASPDYCFDQSPAQLLAIAFATTRSCDPALGEDSYAAETVVGLADRVLWRRVDRERRAGHIILAVGPRPAEL